MALNCLGRATKVEELFSVGKYGNSETEKAQDFLYQARSKILGYCSTTNRDISLRSLFDRANMSAAVMDHDYCKKNYVEYWIDRAVQVGMFRLIGELTGTCVLNSSVF